MNAHKNGVALGIGDGYPGAERNKIITVARHDHAIAGALQKWLQSPGNIERHDFFRDALAGNAAAINAAVTWVNDNGGEAVLRVSQSGAADKQKKGDDKSET